MNLFKSILHLVCGDREDPALQRRKARIEAERAIAFLKEKSAALRTERDTHWSEAETYLKKGQKSVARRALTLFRSNETMLGQLEGRRWLCESLLTKLACNEHDAALADALRTLSRAVTVRPGKIDAALEAASAKCAGLDDVEKVWKREYARRSERLEDAGAPSVDSLMKDLESAVAASAKAASPRPAVTDGRSGK